MGYRIRLRAFAKINLGLKVLLPRPDGYHEIRTIYQTVAMHDRLDLAVTRRPGIILDCQYPVPMGRDNLVYRACEVWRAARKFKGGIRVRLEKRIPAGSGLGGGSSDAAAAIMGLERLTGNRLDAQTRFRLAAGLGSDVPLFLLGGRVLGCGRGEEVYPLTDLPPRKCLVAHPGFSISTREAYQQLSLRLTSRKEGRKVDAFGVWSWISPDGWGPAENDFESVVFAKWPELGNLKSQFIRAGAETASLTGSGSAVYAVFDSARKLIRASKAVPQDWVVFRTRTLRRRECQRLLFSTSPDEPTGNA
ncbi:MAG: 4-(cytidine 5'-diphospho)-2-C-methyl-D-erythritol kinase [Terriglobia bacterium]